MFLMKEHVGKLISDVEELIYREKKPVDVVNLLKYSF